MFTELHSLARAASLLISVAAEGDALRVTVNAAPTTKNGPAMHPLVLVGTPDELDAGFAQAIQIFEPSALPLLQQAEAAAIANGNKGKGTPKETAKPSAKADTAAAGTPAKRGPGRPPKNASTAATDNKDATPPAENPGTGADEGTAAPEVDPRQMSLVDAEAANGQGSTEPATAEPAPAEQTADAQHTEPASADPRDTGLDLPI